MTALHKNPMKNRRELPITNASGANTQARPVAVFSIADAS
jgi:hypothetical protein